MRTDTNIKIVQNMKYNLNIRLLLVMFTTVVLLACASLYSQEGYESFHIQPVLIISFLLTLGYFLYRICKDKGFFHYMVDRCREYGKTPTALLLSLICLIILGVRFLLKDIIVFYVQNAFYMGAIIFVIFGIFSLIYCNKKC